MRLQACGHPDPKTRPLRSKQCLVPLTSYWLPYPAGMVEDLFARRDRSAASVNWSEVKSDPHKLLVMAGVLDEESNLSSGSITCFARAEFAIWDLVGVSLPSLSMKEKISARTEPQKLIMMSMKYHASQLPCPTPLPLLVRIWSF